MSLIPETVPSSLEAAELFAALNASPLLATPEEEEEADEDEDEDGDEDEDEDEEEDEDDEE